MKITTTKFKKGVIDGNDDIFVDGTPQVAFIGRSNVGKSSLINALTKSNIARTSSFPGRTQEINVALMNDAIYIVDLPGYGFARLSAGGRGKIGKLIESYLFNPDFDQHKIVLIVDANVGFMEKDLAMLEDLKMYKKDFIIALSKIDKMNQSEFHHKMKEMSEMVGGHPMFAFSAKKQKGIEALREVLFGDILSE